MNKVFSCVASATGHNARLRRLRVRPKSEELFGTTHQALSLSQPQRLLPRSLFKAFPFISVAA